MRVLQIGSDRSKRGILFPGTPGVARQLAYAKEFGHLDIIGFSRRTDNAKAFSEQHLSVHPTNSSSPLLYGLGALRIAKNLQKPDVVSAQDPFEVGLVAWFIARWLGVPIHVQVHTDFLSKEYARLSVLNRLRVLIAGYVIRRAARIRVVSNRVKESIENRYKINAPITVLPIFVDISKFRNAEPIPTSEKDARFSFKTKVLLVARDTPEKNVDLAIEVFKNVAPPDACLLLSADIHRVPFGDARIFGMGSEGLEHWYKTVDLVLVPSKYEGYGLVIIEALAAGKPVLATDVGVAREMGAIITSEKDLARDLARWFENGPRSAELKHYPYRNFDEYVRMYCDDIRACTSEKLSL